MSTAYHGSPPRKGKNSRQNQPSMFRTATLDRHYTAKNLLHLTSHIRRAGKPDLEKLRELCLDSSLVIDAKALQPVGVIGEGAFGVVWKCTVDARSFTGATQQYLQDGNGFVALKRMKFVQPPAGVSRERRESVDQKSIAAFSSELLMLKSLFHPNIIGYIGCIVFDEEGADHTGRENTIAIVQEFAPHGTLQPLIQNASALSCPFSIGDGLRWAHHIACGMAFLHECTPSIVHRDLKPENVLLCGPRCTAKLADFGLMTFDQSAISRASHAAGEHGEVGTGEQKQAPYKGMTGKVGSARYMGPENWRSEEYSYKTDMYSFAILLYELLVRRRAYHGQFLAIDQIAEMAATRGLRPAMPPRWPQEAKELLSTCWDADPAKRPEFRAVAERLASWRNDERGLVLAQIWKSSPVPAAERLGQYRWWGKQYAARVTGASAHSGAGSSKKGADGDFKRVSIAKPPPKV